MSQTVIRLAVASLRNVSLCDLYTTRTLQTEALCPLMLPSHPFYFAAAQTHANERGHEMIQMIITQNCFLTHIISGRKRKSPCFWNWIRSENTPSTILVPFLLPAFAATLSHINGFFISLILLPYMVFLVHELVLGDASLRAPELGKCRRSVPQNVVSQGSVCQCRSPHGPAHRRGLFFLPLPEKATAGEVKWQPLGPSHPCYRSVSLW